MEKQKNTAAAEDCFMRALKNYCKDCPNLDVVETKFGPVSLWVDQDIQTGKKMVFHGEFVDAWESTERYLYSELKCAAIDLFCKEEPYNGDPAFYPSDEDIHSRLVMLIMRYLPWVEDIEAYIMAREQEASKL